MGKDQVYVCDTRRIYLNLVVYEPSVPQGEDCMNDPLISSSFHRFLREKQLRPSRHHTAAVRKVELGGALGSLSSLCLGEN